MGYRISYILLMCLGLYQLNGQEDALRRANLLYEDEQYQGAVAVYDSLMNEGDKSFALFYNQGNAYLALRQVDQAILNYERALLIDETEALRHNLNEARTLIAEPIPEFSDFFLYVWWKGLLTALGANGYAILALLTFVLGLILLFRMWNGGIMLPSWVGYAILLIAMVFLALSFAAGEQARSESYAVVMISPKELYESPDERSEKLRNVSPGIKVQIIDRIGEWRKVSLPDKDVGWMHKDWISVISL